MEQSPELEQIIAGWFESVSRGDASWADRHISRDPTVRLVGTGPEEWLQGERVAEFLKEEVEAMGETSRSRPGTLRRIARAASDGCDAPHDHVA